MDIKNIHYLFALEELGNMSVVASRFYISQPTLSQFLKKYEDYLGKPIFFRTKEGLKLTQEGEIFLDTARQMIKAEQDMKNHLADLSDMMSGSITLALSSQRAPILLPIFLPEFTQKYPNISIRVVEGHTKDMEFKLQRGEINLAILVPPLSNPALPCEPFLEEEIFLAVPKSMPFHAEIHRNPGCIPWVDPKQLSGYPFLMYDITYRLYDFTRELFDQYQIQPSRSFTFKNITMVAKLASNGMGITVLPETFVDLNYDLDYYSIGPGGSFRSLALGYPPYSYRSNAVKRFAQVLIESVRSNQETFRAEYAKRFSETEEL
ncbi:MAG: LysR family transcriptional regulator [Lachnospiraceae bacterium]|nr:LysR family transcriptional regulator [Lachnospiraceae bacterium]